MMDLPAAYEILVCLAGVKHRAAKGMVETGGGGGYFKRA